MTLKSGPMNLTYLPMKQRGANAAAGNIKPEKSSVGLLQAFFF